MRIIGMDIHRVAAEVVRERIALLAQRVELAAAFGDQLVFVSLFSHWSSTIPASGWPR